MMLRLRRASLFSLPIALFAVVCAKAYWYPFLLWPFPQKAFDPEILRCPRQLLVALAALMAPLPLGLSAVLALKKRLREAKPDLVGVLMTQLAVMVGVELTVFFGLVSVGLASERVALPVLAAISLAGCWVVRRLWEADDSAVAREALVIYGLMAATLVVCGLASVHFGQDVSWDLFNYHYYNAYAFLHGRERFDFAVADMESHLNPLLDVTVYLLIQTVRPVWVGFTVGAAHGIAAVLLFCLAYEVLGRAEVMRGVRVPLAVACAVTGVGDPIYLGQLGTYLHDNLLASLVLASLLLVVRVIGRMPGARLAEVGVAVALAGILVGLPTGFKLTTATFALGMVAVLIVAPKGWRAKLGLATAFGVGAGLGFLISNGYWMVHLYARYGSPIFPLYNTVFKSPYWGDQDVTYLHITAEFSWKQHLLAPFYLVENTKLFSEVASRDTRLAAAYGLLLLVGLGRFVALARADWRSPTKLGETLRGPLAPDAVLLIVFAVVSYVIWYAKFRILRYLVTVKVLLPLVCVILLFDLFRRRGRVWVSSAVLLVMVAAKVDVASWGRREWQPNFLAYRISKPIESAENGIVLMTWIGAGGDSAWPFGAIVAELPQTMRYIKIDSPQVMNPFGPQPLGMQVQARKVIDAHGGPFFLLTHNSPQGLAWAAKMLDRYDLRVADHQTSRTIDNWRQNLGYWRVERKTGVAGAVAARPGAGVTR